MYFDQSPAAELANPNLFSFAFGPRYQRPGCEVKRMTDCWLVVKGCWVFRCEIACICYTKHLLGIAMVASRLSRLTTHGHCYKYFILHISKGAKFTLNIFVGFFTIAFVFADKLRQSTRNQSNCKEVFNAAQYASLQPISLPATSGTIHPAVREWGLNGSLLSETSVAEWQV